MGPTWGLIGVVLGLLAVATAVGQLLKRYTESGINPAAVETFNARVRAWWMLCSLLGAAVVFPNSVTVTLFGLISFWALREFITLTPTRLGDHRSLFWVFFLFTPLQYVLVGMHLYEWYSILIPVYAFLFIPARVAIAGDYKRFLERAAKIQSGLLVCVYCLSFAPALLELEIPDKPGQTKLLLFFFVVMVQLCDALQHTWDGLFGRHHIAPAVSSSRTWEGFLGGSGSAMLLGTALYWATPFSPLETGAMTALISVMALAGGMTMSAIKRDRGVKDYGTLVQGHGGVLDRIDSICFAAPVFFHATRYLLTELR
ncbi:MAG: phosphatidate cytidylyltransferase [Planctomycetales bacterium]|nr:phosphatidate cytidylyltransferase [Planctomycetales bacterium]